MLRVNSHAGLSYVAWKCTSSGPLSTAPNAAQQPNKLHSQWIPQRHVAVVHPASPDANAALGRGPHDSKFEVDNPRVELWSSKGGSVGRFTVAKQCIRPGERAFQASAFAVVVRQSLAPRRCHWCFAALRKKALQCGDCEFARYCSRECLAADAALHDFQCPALRELKRRGERAGVGDVETVRLALAVLSMEEFVRNPRALELLAVHRRRDADEEKEVRSAVAVIVEMTGRVVDPKHVQLTLERVRCDAHPLYLDGVTCVGTGVFPEAAMALNHSCLPNVAPSFDPRTRTLAFHAIAEIPRGCAVECAYVDLLQTRKRRHSLLAAGFGFDCICGRCTNEAAVSGKKQSAANEDEEEDKEKQLMEQLMILVNAKDRDVKQRIARLKGVTSKGGAIYGSHPVAGGMSEITGTNHKPITDRVLACVLEGRYYKPVLLNDVLGTTGVTSIPASTQAQGYRVVRHEGATLSDATYATYMGTCSLMSTTLDMILDTCDNELGYHVTRDALRVVVDGEKAAGSSSDTVYLIEDSLPVLVMPFWDNAPFARYAVPGSDGSAFVRLGYVVFGGQFLLTFDAWDVIMNTAVLHRVYHLWNYRVVLFPLRQRDGYAAVSDKPVVCRLDDARLDLIPFWDIAAQPVKC
ncbi:putative histone tail methylase containing SET domain [Phytophthora cinnamomi]|uniref:putative histone tail methylase containing SET domain n=1 Tax=Phytophthora cinnamomi TaxID=4785 RepID=UPI003559A544|nr:putative histone tail methylase containing SET domain [Phytophthora cinnamomi]